MYVTIHKSTCPLDCADACGILVETDASGRFSSLRGNPEHSYSRGVLCGKTAIYGDLVHSPDRLRKPLLRAADGELHEASWKEALDTIAARMAGVDGERILALSYAGNMGQVARRFPMRMMNALGATLHDGGICDNTGAAGHELVLGAAHGADLELLEGTGPGDRADALLLWGTDIARTLQHLQPSVKALCRAGVPVFAIDIYRTDTIAKLEQWGGRGLIVRPGSDAALALCLARAAFERGHADRDFLRAECLGAEAFEAELLADSGATRVAECERISGLAPEEIEELYTCLVSARRPFIKTGVGWTRRQNGGMGMRAVCSLAAVLGRADRLHFESTDFFELDAEVVERSDLRTPEARREPVYQVQLGSELAAGRYSVVFVWGHNPAVTLPDSVPVCAGLAREDVFVVCHDHFLTETARLSDVVLPAATFVEQADVFKSYGHRTLHHVHRACQPPGEARSNVAAFAAIAKRLGLERETWDVSEEGLCAELLHANAGRFGAGEIERLLAGEPVKLGPPASVAHNGAARRRRWPTPSGKVELESERAAALGQPRCATYVPDRLEAESGAFNLICAPSRATHNSTFSHSPRHIMRAGAPCCIMHPADARELGLGEGDPVTLKNRRAALTLPVRCSADMPRGLVRVDGLPRAEDVPERLGINALTSPELSDVGAGNVLYSTRVDLVPARTPSAVSGSE